MKKLFTLIGAVSVLFVQAQNITILKITSPTVLVTAAGTSRQVELAEYSKTGIFIKTTKVAATGMDKFVVEDRRIAHEGQLHTSTDGKYLTAIGYNNVVGIGATALRAEEKVVIRVDDKWAIDYSTRIPTKEAFNGAGVRATASIDGSKYFVCSSAPGASQGTREILHGTKATTLVSDKQYRSIGIFGGTFFGVTQDAIGAMEGDGIKLDIPEMTGDLTQFVFFDLDPAEGWNGTGLDALYIANRNSGIRKYYYDGVKWVFVSIYNTTIANSTGFVGLIGEVVAGKPTLYGIKILDADNTSSLIRIIDKTKPKETWNATGKYPDILELATAGSTELFKGLAFFGKESVATNDIANTQLALIISPSVTNDEIRVGLPTENASTT